MALRGLAAVLSGQQASEIDEAAALARTAGDTFALAFALQAHGIAHLMTDPPRARAYLEESARIADALGNRWMANLALMNLGCVLWWGGRVNHAAVFCAQVADRAEEINDRVSLCASLNYRALALAEADDRAEALAAAERVDALGQEAGLRLWATYVPLVKSQVSLSSGNAPVAFVQATEAAHLAHIPLSRANVLPALVEAELALKSQDAIQHVAELVELCRAARFSYYLAWGVTLQARLYRLEGQLSDAADAAHDALVAAVAIDAVRELSTPSRFWPGSSWIRAVSRRLAASSVLPNSFGRTPATDGASLPATLTSRLLGRPSASRHSRRSSTRERAYPSTKPSLTPNGAEANGTGLERPDPDTFARSRECRWGLSCRA